MTIKNKCKLKDKFINPCIWLKKNLNDYGTKQKGFNLAELKNLETLEKIRDIIFYKMDSKDKGVVLNFCPWCGEKLHDQFGEENA